MRLRDRSEHATATERGSATVNALVMIGVLTTVALIVASAGGVFAAHRTAASAADLAALAGAEAMQLGQPGCAAAERIAEANRARLLACRPEGKVITLTVAVELDAAFGSQFTLRGRARAGPVTQS